MATLTNKELEQLALGMGPALKIAMRAVRNVLPPGTDFAVLIEVQSETTQTAAVVAAATDQQRMARRAAEWVLQVMEPGA